MKPVRQMRMRKCNYRPYGGAAGKLPWPKENVDWTSFSEGNRQPFCKQMDDKSLGGGCVVHVRNGISQRVKAPSHVCKQEPPALHVVVGRCMCVYVCARVHAARDIGSKTSSRKLQDY